MQARPNAGQPSLGQPFILFFISSLTLPGVIPPTLVPEAVKVMQCQLKGLGRFPQQIHFLMYQPTYVGQLTICRHLICPRYALVGTV
jgi:hypothetical protein